MADPRSSESEFSAKIRYQVGRYLGIRSAYSPTFSSDDAKVAFISDVSGVPQVWVTDLRDPSRVDQLTISEERVGFVSHARSRDMLAYGADVGGDERFQISILENGGASMKRMTNNPGTIHNWGDWSPDERQIAYSSNLRNESYFDIYVQGIDDESGTLVYQYDGNNYPVCWSPNGDSILFVRLHAPFNHDLYLLHLRDGEAELLTPHEGDAVYLAPCYDPSGQSIYCATDQGREFTGIARIDLRNHSLSYLHTEGWDVEELALSRDGKSMAFTVNEDGYSKLVILRDGDKQEVDAPSGVLSGLKWSNRGTMLAFTFSASRFNPDVWLYDLVERRTRRVTRSSTSGIPEDSFVREQLFRYRSFDGLEMPAFVFLPRREKEELLPLVVYLHGGPESQFRPGFSPLIQYLLSQGFAVAAPNFRGGTGYGRRFTHLDDVNKRMDAVRDIESFIASAQEKIQLDPKRVAAWGGSYGGFMVLACLYSYPKRWSAGVDIVGITNFITFLNNTGSWRRKLRIPEYGDPEKDAEFLEKISPVNNAHLITAPLFIIHGTNDPRVPFGEAGQIVETLKKLQREVHLLKFDDEGHGLVKLKNRVTGYSAAIQFLLNHLHS